MIKFFLKWLKAGTSSRQDHPTNRAVWVTNALAFFQIGICSFYVAVQLSTGDFAYALLSFACIGINILALLLNRKGYITLSRWIVTILIYALITLGSSSSGEETNLYLLFFTLLPMPLIFFTFEERKHVVISFLILIGCIVTFEVCRQVYPHGFLPYTPAMKRLWHVAVFYESLILLFATIFFFTYFGHRAEKNVALLNRRCINAARQIGAAEIANNVLHNVGNVLNSINVSIQVIERKVRNQRLAGLGDACTLLEKQQKENAVSPDLPLYFRQLAVQMRSEQDVTLDELATLAKHLEHMRKIIEVQQHQAKTPHFSVLERLAVEDVLEDAIRINLVEATDALIRVDRTGMHRVIGNIDRHKLLQILVNLVSNAKYALLESSNPVKTLRLVCQQEELPQGSHGIIRIEDNGVGIAKEHLTEIFFSGYTRRNDGHGLGLHFGAIAAREMGGTLSAESEGPGKGAAFTLRIPI